MPGQAPKKIEGKDKKELEWYFKLPEQIRKDGDELFYSLFQHFFSDELKEARLEKDSEWADFGLIQKSCIYYFKRIHDLTAIKMGNLEKIKKLKNRKNQKVKERKAKFEDKIEVARLSLEIKDLEVKLKDEIFQSYERTKKYLERHANFSTSFIIDAIESVEWEFGAEQDIVGDYTTGLTNPISHWANLEDPGNDKRKYGPEVLLIKIIQKHIADIAQQNIEVELNQEVAMAMPVRAVEKTWTINFDLEKRTVALHELTDSKQLDIEGVLMANCVGEKSWEQQIKVKPETGQPEIRIFSLAMEAEEGEHFLINETDGGVNLEEEWADNFQSKVAKRFDVDITSSSGDDADFNLLESFSTSEKPPFFWTREIDDFYKQEKEKLDKKLETKICRLPQATILYDVNKQTIEQIKLFQNEKIDDTTNPETVRIVIEAIIELCKKNLVIEIGDLGSLRETKYWKENFEDKELILLKSGEVISSTTFMQRGLMSKDTI